MDIQLRVTLGALLLVDLALLIALFDIHRVRSGQLACTACWRNFAALALASHTAYFLRGWLPAEISIILTNATLALACGALLAGCADLAGRPIPHRIVVAAALALQPVYALLTFAYPNETARLQLSALVFVAACAEGARRLARPADPALRPVFAPGVFALGLSGAVSLARVATLAVPWLRPWDFVFLLLTTGLETLIGFAYLRMIDHLRLRELRRSADEKALLLREMRHRTQNNLALISSLVALQADQIKDERAGAAFVDLQNRLRTIQSVYRLLSGDDKPPSASIREYLAIVASGLRDSLPPGRRIGLELEAADIDFNPSALVPLGLIANELATNAIKHAFSAGVAIGEAGAAVDGGRTDAAGTIRLEFRRDGDRFRLTVSDDGRGSAAAAAEGLGLTLVRSLAAQLRGGLSLAAGERGGTIASVDFPAVS